MPTLFAMTVDTEEEWDWDAGWPTGRPSLANIRKLPAFQGLCSRFGVATTYFANRAVLADPDACRVLLELAGRDRVEIGMHIHPWNTPPLAGDGPVPARESFLHRLGRDLILQKLGATYEAFQKLGLRPTSFRGGRYSSGGPIHEFLHANGFEVDSSVVPYTAWADDGAPDYRSRGPEPVRLPPRFDGDRALWEIPITLGFSRPPDGFWRRGFDFVERSWLGRLRLIGVADRLGIVSRIWLNFEDTPAEKMLLLLNRLRRERPRCICFTVHSSSFLAGGNPYTRTPTDEDRILRRIERVFEILAAWPEFRPATMTGIARSLEEAHHESTRHQPVG